MYSLKPFSPFPFSGHVSSQFLFKDDRLVLEYFWPQEWTLDEFPALSSRSRAHELWKSTCFEAFLKSKNSKEYDEINLAPSGQWNAYHFIQYRTPAPPQEAAGWSLVDLKSQRGLVRAELIHPYASLNQLKIGLTCILRLNNQSHYWALQHPPSQPDFHWEGGMLISN